MSEDKTTEKNFFEKSDFTSSLKQFNVVPQVSAKDKEWADEMMKKAAGKRKEKRKVGEAGTTLTLTSLMDIFTNILLYLLINLQSSPVAIQLNPQNFMLPYSDSATPISPNLPVTIMRNAIIVNNKKVVELGDSFSVDRSLREGGKANSPVITPLLVALEEERKKIERQRGKNFTGEILIIADINVPARVLRDVAYSVGRAQFTKFKFTVIKRKP